MIRWQLAACFLLSTSLGAAGCAASIHRQGYTLPEDAELAACEMPIQSNAGSDLNEFELLGEVEVADSGFSTSCDEALVLHRLVLEACYLDADLINITQERRPDSQSTCYQAKAMFLRLRDRSRRAQLASDDEYAAGLVRNRAEDTHRRNRSVISGAVVNGVVSGAAGMGGP